MFGNDPLDGWFILDQIDPLHVADYQHFIDDQRITLSSPHGRFRQGKVVDCDAASLG